MARTHGAAYACEELAKHHEWQTGDLTLALDWTQKAVEQVRTWSPGIRRRQALDDLAHRQARLQQKLEE